MIGTHALLIFLLNFYHGYCRSLPLVCALLSGSHGSLQFSQAFPEEVQ